MAVIENKKEFIFLVGIFNEICFVTAWLNQPTNFVCPLFRHFFKFFFAFFLYFLIHFDRLLFVVAFLVNCNLKVRF